jgi:hypothetical protein
VQNKPFLHELIIQRFLFSSNIEANIALLQNLNYKRPAMTITYPTFHLQQIDRFSFA